MLQILNPFRAGQEFQKLKSEKKWMLALVIVFVPGLLSIAGHGLVQQEKLEFSRQLAKEWGIFTRGEIEERQDSLTLYVVIGIVFSILFIPVDWVMASVLFHGFAKILGGEEVHISSTIHVIAYTYLPWVFLGLWGLYRGATCQPISPAHIEEGIVLFHLEYVVTRIFGVWVFILRAIAVRELYNLSNRRAVIVVLVSNVAYSIISWGLNVIISLIFPPKSFWVP